MKEEQFNVVVSDYNLPEMNGLELFKRIRSENKTIPFILFTERLREEVAIETFNLGATRYIHRAGDLKSLYAELTHGIRSFIKYQQTKDTLAQMGQKLRQMEEKLRNACQQRVSSFCRAFFHGMAYPVSIDFANISDHKKGRK